MKQKDLLESALSSLEKMHAAEPGPRVLAGIQSRLQNSEGARLRKLPLGQLRLAVAGLALLLTANILLVTQWESKAEINEDAYASTSLVDDYNIYSNE